MFCNAKKCHLIFTNFVGAPSSVSPSLFNCTSAFCMHFCSFAWSFFLSLNCLWFPLFWSFEFGMLYWWLSIFMPLLRALHFVHAKLLCCLFTMRRFIRFTVFCGGIVPNELCVLWNAYANIIVHCWIVTVAQSN